MDPATICHSTSNFMARANRDIFIEHGNIKQTWYFDKKGALDEVDALPPPRTFSEYPLCPKRRNSF